MITTTASELIDVLAQERARYPYPLCFRSWPERFAAACLGLLFPQYSKTLETRTDQISEEIDELRNMLLQGLDGLPEVSHRVPLIADQFIDRLAEIRAALLLDADAVYTSDPAADSVDQVMFCYPGFYATAIYRLAHQLHLLDVPLLPRMLSEHAHRTVGIDIHPAAQIGKSLFIDHGTGIVIGGTAVLGDRIKLYQGVTLGALQVHKRLSGTRRHPTIEDDVVVYAHATILGDIVIGARSILGGNTWITQSVPPNTVVSNRNAVRRTADPSHDEVPDFSI
jgi:serine O-acetyltransferase